MLKSEEIIKVVNALNGPIEPVADSAIDSERKEQFDNYRQIFDTMGNRIANVYIEDYKSPFGSCSEIGKMAKSSLKQMRDYLADILENY